MTSEALTDILCARSATEMVSGTCTSWTTCSVGAWKLLEPESRSRPPRAPPRGARQPGRPAPADAPAGAPRPLLASPRFLAASSAQLEESFSDLTAFLSPGLAPGAVGAP